MNLAALRPPIVYRVHQAMVAAVCAAALASGPARGDPPSDAQIIRNFDIIALRSEHSRVATPRLAKWRRPVRVYMQADVPVEPRVRDYTRTHMRRLSELTGLAMFFVARRGAANFVIIFTDGDRFRRAILRHLDPKRRDLADRLSRAACVGLFRRDAATNQIIHAVAIIPVDTARRRGVLKSCIVEETTQVMGLPNDSSDVRPSIFNDRGGLDDLSGPDVLLLRLLYDPRLKAGMTRDEALATARRILPELRVRAGR